MQELKKEELSNIQKLSNQQEKFINFTKNRSLATTAHQVKDVVYPKGSRVCIVDMDVVIFRVASACQKTSILVTNLEGKKKKFKNRTKFKEYCEKHSMDSTGFTIEDVVEPEPISFAIKTLKDSLAKILKNTEADYSELYFGGTDNFRDKLPLIEKYKGSRTAPKPVHLEALREYALNKMSCVFITGRETDDVVQQRLVQINTNPNNNVGILATIDKDAYQLYQSKGVIYNLLTQELKDLEGGLGSLYLNYRGEVKGDGLIWLIYQVNQGDMVDCYSQKPFFNRKFGSKGFYQRFGHHTDTREFLQDYVEFIKELIPDEVEYQTFYGESVKFSRMDLQDMYFECAYMKISPDDPTTFRTLLDEYGVDHD